MPLLLPLVAVGGIVVGGLFGIGAAMQGYAQQLQSAGKTMQYENTQEVTTAFLNMGRPDLAQNFLVDWNRTEKVQQPAPLLGAAPGAEPGILGLGVSSKDILLFGGLYMLLKKGA